MRPEITAGARVNLGHGRENQEDAYGFKPSANLSLAELRHGLLFVVADGVGGERAGDLASRTAVQTIIKQYYEGEARGVAGLLSVLQEANMRILEQAQNPLYAGMATTVVCALIKGGELIVAHAGDSRAYLYRAGQLTQLTRDHSWVEDQVRRSRMTPEEAAQSPRRHMITRSLGRQAEVQPEITACGFVEDGDRILLCTDGLHDVVPGERLCKALSHGEAAETCDELVQLALDGQSADNITALVLDVHLVEGEDVSAEVSPVMVAPLPGLRDETEPHSQRPAENAAPASSSVEPIERRINAERQTAAHAPYLPSYEWAWQVCGAGATPRLQQRVVELSGLESRRLTVAIDFPAPPHPSGVRAVQLAVEIDGPADSATETKRMIQVVPAGYYASTAAEKPDAFVARTGSHIDLPLGGVMLVFQVERATYNTAAEQVFRELVLRFRVEAAPHTAAA